MLTYRGDRFIRGKKFTINEGKYIFSKRQDDKLVFESVDNGSKLIMTENEFNKSEQLLTEKINQENKETNEIIGKVLRSKGLARKYEDMLKAKGITVDYSNPQGVTLVGPNGKELSASSKNVYGPSEPGQKGTHTRNDSWYSDRAKESKERYDSLKSMKRDDIIRKYSNLDTKEALKKHKDDLERAEKDYKDYKQRADSSNASTKKSRREGQLLSPRSSYNTEYSKAAADYYVDYLNYLTKPNTGDDFRNGKAYYQKGQDNSGWGTSYPTKNPVSNDNSESLNKYNQLKREVSRAASDAATYNYDDSGDGYYNRYYAAMNDEQLEKRIKEMKQKLQQQIADLEAQYDSDVKDLRDRNKQNIKTKDEKLKALKDKEKELDTFLKSKGVREAVLNFVNKPILSESADESKFEHLNSEISEEVDNLINLAMEAEECGYEALKRAYENAADILENYSHYSDSIYQKEDGTYGRIMSAQEAKDSGIYDVIEKYRKTHKDL